MCDQGATSPHTDRLTPDPLIEEIRYLYIFDVIYVTNVKIIFDVKKHNQKVRFQ